MSIAPPSDIVFDVAQAADPLKLQAATSKLAQAARAAGPPSFDAALDTTAMPGLAGRPPIHAGVLPAALGRQPLETRQVTTDRKFEAMVLQNFIENILPKDANLFGDAASADMCRSLMAEQIANQLARTGRIGIAKSLEHFQNTEHAVPAPAATAPPATGA